MPNTSVMELFIFVNFSVLIFFKKYSITDCSDAEGLHL